MNNITDINPVQPSSNSYVIIKYLLTNIIDASIYHMTSIDFTFRPFEWSETTGYTITSVHGNIGLFSRSLFNGDSIFRINAFLSGGDATTLKMTNIYYKKDPSIIGTEEEARYLYIGIRVGAWSTFTIDKVTLCDNSRELDKSKLISISTILTGQFDTTGWTEINYSYTLTQLKNT